MVLDDKTVKKIVDFVKPEPRTVQEISKNIKKSWLTTDSYVKQIKERTGLISIKTFRAGTQGALKLVFYSNPNSLQGDDVRQSLYQQIKSGRRKEDFDFMEVYQFVPDKKKKFFTQIFEKDDVTKSLELGPLLKQAESQVYIFSGNMSFLNSKEKNKRMLDIVEGLLKRKVMIRVLCRVNIASLKNLGPVSRLMVKYPGLIEARHCYQPLRGFIVDDKIARFKNEENVALYRKGELDRDTRIFYEIYDDSWVTWMQTVFWNLFRSSIDLQTRLREIKKSAKALEKS